KNQSVVIQFFLPGITDADEDHFPDTAELNAESDRNAFLDWFVRIAESQFKKKNYGWNPDEQDCSGLIRYSYREALKKHNTEWYRKNGIVMDKNLPDVDRFNYPDVPLIGKKIFKIKKGPASDPESFGVYADAKTLMSFNLDFISRDINEANQGDILFFHDPDNFNSPYHSMIVVKNDLQDIILLYHTGTEQGIKRIPLSYLENSERFYPGVWNRYFMGIFRFHIIR
ncbi:MAG: DUF1175 domain-containing protein, partial [Spirochaetia bacterium]|nr:DUF1175 domain-containing protein [Spirochaetia bacterium]